MTSYIPNLLTDNISLHTIPVLWILGLIPGMWGRKQYEKAVGHEWDYRNPRSHYSTVANDKALDPQLKGRLMRADGAMQNNLDNIGLFAAAVVAGNLAKLSPRVLNGLSLGYFVCRVLHMYTYIRNETYGQAVMRAVWFCSGLSMVFALFVKAGNRLMHAG